MCGSLSVFGHWHVHTCQACRAKNVQSLPTMSRAPKLPKSFYYTGGGALFLGIAYTTYEYARSHVEAQHAAESTDDKSSRDTFSKIAEKYDASVGMEETFMGLGIIRRWYLNKHVKGKVLEIAAGTGRNLPYYNYSGISHLTLTDVSRPMLKQAEDKYFDTLKLGYRHPDTKVSFAVCDAHCLVEGPTPSEPTSEGNKRQRSWWARSSKGTTQPTPTNNSAQQQQQQTDNSDQHHIVIRGTEVKDSLPPLKGDGGSIFNLFRVLIPGAMKKPGTDPPSPAFLKAHEYEDMCYQSCCHQGRSPEGYPLVRFPPASFDTVVDTYGLCSQANPVQVLKEVARVVKPDGKIVMIEHGRGHGDWINNKLDNNAERHKCSWGCWYNRDILEIIKEAGLKVDYISRWHFGTTYVIVAKPCLLLPDAAGK